MTWKDIPGYEGIYEINKLGQIKSYAYKNSSRYKNLNGTFYLKLKADKDGYLRCALYKNKKSTYFYVHRLVLQTFNPIKNIHLFQINHKDGMTTNNKIENLEWCTCIENIRHSIVNFKNRLNENNPNCKFTNKNIQKIRQSCLDIGKKKTSEKFDISMGYVYKLSRGEYRKV